MLRKTLHRAVLLLVILIGFLATELPHASADIHTITDDWSVTNANNEIVITESAGVFSGTLSLTGVSNPANVTVNCGTICTSTPLDGSGNSTLALTNGFLDTIKYGAKETLAEISIDHSDGKPATIVVKLKIAARLTNLVVKQNGTNLAEPRVVNMVQNENSTFTVTYSIDGTAQNTFRLKPLSSSGGIVSIAGGVITAQKSGTANVDIFADNTESSKIGSIIVKVTAAIRTLESARGTAVFLSETASKFLEIRALGDDKANVGLENVTCSTPAGTTAISIVEVSGGYNVTANTLPIPAPGSRATEVPTPVTCKVDAATFGNAADLIITVTVQPKDGSVTVTALNGTTLLPHGSLSFITSVFDEKGDKTTAGITYVLESEPQNKQWVSLSPSGDRLVVNWVNLPQGTSGSRPEFINIEVQARRPLSNYPIRGNITIHMTSVEKFSALKVKLNVMDTRTAKDLFGKVADDEYYILIVRLFNDLKDKEGNRYAGQSVLAYSSSIEVAVGLEKKYDDELGSAGVRLIDKKDAKNAQKAANKEASAEFTKNLATIKKLYDGKVTEFNSLMNTAMQLEKTALDLEIKARGDIAYEKPARDARKNADAAYKHAMSFRDKIRNLYQDSILPLPNVPLPGNAAVDDGRWYPASRDDLINIASQNVILSDDDDDSPIFVKDNEPNCVDTITYRPFTFEMMVNTVDRREERTRRSIVFKILDFASLGLTSVTAVAIPPKGSDLPLGIEKFGNMVIPGLENIIPNLKEQHRQNIVSMAMKPIEEIPFGSDITRVIFVPKKEIEGLVIGHQTRISQICPFYFKVKVAVVSKGADVQLGSQQTR